MFIIHKGKQAAEFFNVGQRFPATGRRDENAKCPGKNKQKEGRAPYLITYESFRQNFFGFFGYFF